MQQMFCHAPNDYLAVGNCADGADEVVTIDALDDVAASACCHGSYECLVIFEHSEDEDAVVGATPRIRRVAVLLLSSGRLTS